MLNLSNSRPRWASLATTTIFGLLVAQSGFAQESLRKQIEQAAAMPDGPDKEQRLDKLGANATGVERALAAEAMADLHARRGDADAANWYSDALGFLDAVDLSRVEGAIRERILQKQRDLQAKSEEQRLGKAYLTYRAGRQAELQERYQNASQAYGHLLADDKVDLWDQPSLPVRELLRAYARLGQFVCLVHDEPKKALKAAQQNKPDDCGPWKGEYLVVLGELYLSVGHDVEQARKCFDEALAWTKTPVQENGWTLPDNLKEVAAAPTDPYMTLGWGNVHLSVPAPSAIVNQFTCSWYRNFVAANATARLALCSFLSGDAAGAAAQAATLVELDPRDAKDSAAGMPSNSRRLIDDFKSGGLFATKEELALFPSKLLPELVLAELDLETERWSQAEAKYHRFLHDHGDEIKQDAKAYLSIPLYMCRIYQNDNAGGDKLLRDMIRDYPKAPSIPRAKLELASGASPEEQDRLVRDVATNYPNSEWSVRAKFTLATHLEALEKYEEATDVIKELMKSNKSSDVQAMCQAHLSSIANIKAGNVRTVP